MKKTITYFIAILAIFFLIGTTSRAQIYANSVISSDGVINPENAADADISNYAILQTPIGILNSAQITLGFSQYGIAGMLLLIYKLTEVYSMLMFSIHFQLPCTAVKVM